MGRVILFIADDFGLNEEVNEAVVHAHLQGVLDGASLMMGQPGTEAAVALARQHPSLQVGWHLHLADSRPCTVSKWPWENSLARAGFAMGFSVRMRELVRCELAYQWEAFCDTGLPCRFANSHHHLHIHPFVRRALFKTLPADFAGWVRWGRPSFFGHDVPRLAYRVLDTLLQAPHRRHPPFRLSTTLWGIDRTFQMNPGEVAAVLPGLTGGLHEFMFHPRRVQSDQDTACLVGLIRIIADRAARHEGAR
jgi:hypothetical protein